MRTTLATRLLALNTDIEASHNARATAALKATFSRLLRQPWFCAGAELANSILRNAEHGQQADGVRIQNQGRGRGGGAQHLGAHAGGTAALGAASISAA